MLLLELTVYSLSTIIYNTSKSCIKECVVSLYTFSCLHMAPDKCRMQSAMPGARIALPSPSCLNLSFPVSTHFQLRNCPIALAVEGNIHSFPHCGTLRQSCKWIRTTLDKYAVFVGGGVGCPAACGTSLQGSQCSHIVSLLICSTTSPAGNDACVK